MHVPAGQTVSVSLPVDERGFLVVNERGERVQEGKVVLYTGVGQPDARTEALTGHASVRIDLE